jgi:hypothetical protein
MRTTMAVVASLGLLMGVGDALSPAFAQEASQPKVVLPFSETAPSPDRRAPVPGTFSVEDLRDIPPPRPDRLQSVRVTISVGDPHCLPGAPGSSWAPGPGSSGAPGPAAPIGPAPGRRR